MNSVHPAEHTSVDQLHQLDAALEKYLPTRHPIGEVCALDTRIWNLAMKPQRRIKLSRAYNPLL